MTDIQPANRTLPADGALAPRLLNVLQQTAVVRLILSVLEASLYVVLSPLSPAWLVLAICLERVLYLVFVTVPGMRSRLGRYFLPIALGWFLAVSFAQTVLAVLYSQDRRFFIILEAGERTGSPLLWLVVPVVLATWQYGLKGLRMMLAGLVLGHVALGAVLWRGLPEFWGYLSSAGGRIAMLTLLGYVVAYLVSAQRSVHAALEQANRELAQRATTAEQLAESRERNRLARELHDTLAHSLTSLSVQLQALGTLLEYDPAAAHAQLRAAQANVRRGANEARRAIQALRATPLESLGLPEALRQLCASLGERTGAAVSFDIAELPALDPLTEQTIYRVAEGTLANIERHAAATSVTLQLGPAYADGARSPGLCLEIRDNGVGFDPAAVPKDRYGLASMSERAIAAGGLLRVWSAPGMGATVMLELPG